ncbi:MAG: bifunctional 2-polyprenyl-6-hydroxyphenol methylase/3-demethylubiquinol 3-O-methyltransferase UbiG, partial [Rhizobiales bacterium]|nr:bifunctional 2-polyprenyl-6-hydroxyphenol methylase/3-demethylubiquinol 3-O-methyltransferase UbiG [Hyphomicrobiales bacterium]
GGMRMLHRINPIHIAFIRDHAVRLSGADPRALDSLAGLRVLDIGCGGGILCEPLARLGAEVVGIDPGEEAVAAARAHAAESDLAIDYRCTTAEAMAAAGERFDVVLAMEVVEHVADVPAFVRAAGSMVKPGGLLVVATLNRTLKSFGLAIVAAEYVLGWVPRGTHRWDRFVTPDELETAIEAAGLDAIEATGVVYDPFADAWQRHDRDLDVNFMMAARRAD